MSVTTVDLLRHGEAEGGDIFRGSIDVALADAGWRQMRAVVAAAEEQSPWDLIVSSPLRRCRAFADDLGERCGVEVHIDAGFREVDFGEWEGRLISEIASGSPGALEGYFRGIYTPAGAEPLAEFAMRIAAGFDQLLARFAGRHLLLVTHGGVIRAVLAAVVEGQLDTLHRFDVPFASFSRVQVRDGGTAAAWPQIVFVNGSL